ncbi:DUF4407 domain-containing protein [uncultured Croceitalea sp.]|uniref:DUF4407 domain-containing protein n=1 Tax=uncultured Croceitalea sp. TaxID=1798908 RepID=UPI003305C4F5
MIVGSPYRLLWKLAGEDAQLLQKCTKGIQLRFALSGIILVLLFIAGLISYQHTFSQIFNIPKLSWLLALIFVLMIFNIYKLNLVTIAAKTNRKGIGYFVSVSCRILFMLLLGLSIIKPLETLYLQEELTIELGQLKNREIQMAQKNTANYFDVSITEQSEKINNLKEQIEEGRIKINYAKLVQLNNIKKQLINDKTTAIIKTKRLIERSPYFVRGLLLLNKKHSWTWYISIAFLTFFLLPFSLKHFTPSSSTYSKSYIELENNIILEEYESFKKQYPTLFNRITDEKITWEEHYKDPPFNQIRKTIVRSIGDEEDFLNHLYGV